MADPYEGSDDRQPRHDRREEEARRAAQRHAEQEAPAPARRPDVQGGDYGSGWYGEDASRRGYPIPGPYGRAPEQDNEGGPDRGPSPD